jgi:type II secretory pathway pseudopilin PulG
MTYTPDSNIIYTNQRADRRLWATIHDSLSVIVSSHSLMGQWSHPDTLPQEVNIADKQAYPYVLSDGVTIYFAACDSNGLGGYDIYVTRYNTYTDSYTTPENLGMPFNSTANDYMMAINEVANLGWFATDRNQPEGKVCVYVFVPNNNSRRVNVNEIGYERALAIANLSSIADTQVDGDVVRNARRQMTMLIYAQDTAEKSGDFLFVIDDFNIYKTLGDFKSNVARELFQEWQKEVENHENDIRRLDDYRDEYASASVAEKEKMRDVILELENNIENDARALELKEYEVRRLELEEKYGN